MRWPPTSVRLDSESAAVNVFAHPLAACFADFFIFQSHLRVSRRTAVHPARRVAEALTDVILPAAVFHPDIFGRELDFHRLRGPTKLALYSGRDLRTNHVRV